MFNIYVVIVKYLLAIVVVMYSFISFDVFVVKKQRIEKERLAKMSDKAIKKKTELYNKQYLKKKSVMFSTQYILIIIIHLLCYSILFLDGMRINYLVIGLCELLFIILYTRIYEKVYKGYSRLLFNNMLFLIDVGFIMISRLSFSSAVKQFIIIIVCSFICLVVPLIIEKFEAIDRFDWIYAIVGLGLLVLVFFLGTRKLGAFNWISIGNTSIQPSEFVKIIFIFCIASMLCKYKDNLKMLVVTTGLAGLHVLVLALEKDLGAALLFFVTYFVMLYVATKKKRYIGTGALVGIIAAVLAYNIPNYKHVKVRVDAWIDPFATINTSGHQVAQSLFAIGTGSWFGMGLTKGLPTSIPVCSSDFIFSAICEELGAIVGIMLILVCLSCFVMFVNIAMLIKKLFYKLIAIGLSTMYIFQVLLTVGGAVKFIPSTGVTLPLVSYGGSSVFSTLVVFSVIQGMYVRKSASYLQHN